MSDLTFRAATPDDVAALHRLIERAYRGETAKAGWTHEADLLFDDRTSAGELSALIADPDRARAMGEAGRARAVEQFGWASIADPTIAVSRGALGA